LQLLHASQRPTSSYDDAAQQQFIDEVPMFSLISLLIASRKLAAEQYATAANDDAAVHVLPRAA